MTKIGRDKVAQVAKEQKESAYNLRMLANLERIASVKLAEGGLTDSRYEKSPIHERFNSMPGTFMTNS